MAKVTIDEKEYETDDLSEEANDHLISLQFTGGEIARLKAKLAAMQTASNSYAKALGEALENEK